MHAIAQPACDETHTLARRGDRMRTASTSAPVVVAQSHFVVKASSLLASTSGVRAGGSASSSWARSVGGELGRVAERDPPPPQGVPHLVDPVAGLVGEQLGELVAGDGVAGQHWRP